MTPPASIGKRPATYRALPAGGEAIPHEDGHGVHYGGDVEVDVIRAYWSLRSLMSTRWLVEHGYGAPATFPEVAVLNTLSARH